MQVSLLSADQTNKMMMSLLKRFKQISVNKLNALDDLIFDGAWSEHAENGHATPYLTAIS